MSLELINLEISLENTPLFDPINLVIQPGEIATVMGPSGCGKSTLLAAISGGISRVFSVTGDIRLNGKSVCSIPMEKREIGILFQDDLLFPHLNIGQNLAFAVPSSISKRDRFQRVAEALSSADLNGFENRDPETLSGGQRARVSLLRSLLAAPKVILLDEPFSKLDQKLKSQIRQFVFERVQEMRIPTLLVTHDPDDCPEGVVINLENGKGHYV